MQELLQASLSLVNAVPSALLVFVLLYWVTVIVGILDFDSLDFDLNTDADTGQLFDVTWLNSALAFFNLGRVPFMFFLTFLALPFWAFSVLGNHYLGTTQSALGFAVLVPALLASLLVAKFLTMPFIKLFAAMEKTPVSNASLIGQVCTVLLQANADQIGQAAVQTKGAPLLLNVKTTQGQLVQKGQTAVVIDYHPEKQLYLIEPYQTL